VNSIQGHWTSEGSARLLARHAASAGNLFYRPSQGGVLSSIGIGTYLGETTRQACDDYVQAIRAAVRGGINVIDTSLNYRSQQSERDVGEAIRGLIESGEAARDELLVCTKAGFLVPGAIPSGGILPGDVVAGMHCMAPAFLEDQVSRSLANLGLATIDVFYLHNPETQLREVSEARLEQRFVDAFARLEDLCSRGVIRFYGTATWNGYRMKAGQPGRLSLPRILELARRAGGEDHHFRFLQLPVNLAMPEAFTLPHAELDGAPASLLEAAARAGVTVAASASILQGRLASGLPDELRARLPGATTDAQRALQFTRSTPGVTTALAGMGRVAHVEENLALRAFAPASIEQYVSIFEREA
jgi:aryl-alcohol dehydrogenase-like predicted oxidoreductase